MSATKKKSKRIFYFDALRALAIISVIIFHIFSQTSSKALIFYSATPTLNWVLADLLATFFRCGVPIFLMLSGALSLGRVWDIKSFLSKRIPRIVLPFLFWGFILSLITVICSMSMPHLIPETVKYTVFGFLEYLVNTYNATNYGFRVYWFFWMILGTYLIMPIFNKWLLHAELKEAEYFLVIWAVTCIFTQTIGVPFPVDLTYFTGPIGMVVLGYYLRHTERKIFSNLWLPVLLMIVGCGLSIIYSFIHSTGTEFFYLGRYSIFMVIEVMGIFLLFKNLSNKSPSLYMGENSVFKKAAESIAKYSYGMYLIHRIVIVFVFYYIKSTTQFFDAVFLLFISSLILSWIIMAVLNRVPYLNQMIGAK